MLIDETSAVVHEKSQTTWRDELTNDKILLNAIDTAIYELTKNGVASYTIDTGQTTQTVTRENLATLMMRRRQLINEIAIIEARLGLGSHKQVRQIVPGF